MIFVCWLTHVVAKHNEYRICVVLFGPYNRYQLHKHNQMTVATLNSHSITNTLQMAANFSPMHYNHVCEHTLHH